MTNIDVGAFGLVLVIMGLATAGFWARRPTRRTPIRRPPPRLLSPDDPEAAWTQALVPRSRLRLFYREESGALTNCVIHPRTIRGEQVGENRVRPSVLNAFCETEQVMRAFRLHRIERATDTLSGEFIDDLYTYLGSAQPGGAPGRAYTTVPSANDLGEPTAAALKR